MKTCSIKSYGNKGRSVDMLKQSRHSHMAMLMALNRYETMEIYLANAIGILSKDTRLVINMSNGVWNVSSSWKNQVSHTQSLYIIFVSGSSIDF